MLSLASCGFSAPKGAASDVMNKGGVPYAISNPPGSTKDWVGTPGVYSTNFHDNVAGEVDYFDVYGEVQTQYSQVYWTRNANIPLPDAIVKKFAGKVMAITGYEVDQVTHDGPQATAREGQPGPLTEFYDCRFQANMATNKGSAMMLKYGSANLTRCRVTDNGEDDDTIAALFMQKGGWMHVTSTIFSGNYPRAS